jgi:hypothetical protein
LPLGEQLGSICPSERSKLSNLASAGSSGARRPLCLEHVGSVSQKVHANLPLAGFLGVEVRGKVIVRVEPEFESDEGDGIDLTHWSKVSDRTF